MGHGSEVAGGPRARRRAVTLHDVAREAGVAVSTVSRALALPGRVSARTEEHVREVAARLGYRPNPAARALPTGRTGMLAVLVPDVTNPHNFGLVRGAESRARAAGYTLVVGDTQDIPEQESLHAERLCAAVDGVALAASRLPPGVLHGLDERRPVVLFNREVPGLASVVTDSVDGSGQIVEHLAALGHRRIAYLGGPRGIWSDGVRRRALTTHAAAAGIEVVACGPFPATVEGGPAAADAGLATGATTLVAFNDLLAIGVLRRLEALGVAVPGRVGVVGYDDIFGADFCHPPLTTVAAPVGDAGGALVELLLDPDRVPRTRTLPTRLVVRRSTGAAP